MISRGGDYRTDTPVSIGDPDKVQSWPFKEPEKRSAWTDKDLAAGRDTPAPANMFRDVELDSAAKRTELIKARMSPPGALGLPPLLEQQRIRWGIPDGAFKTQAIFDRIHIFPIDLFDNAEMIPGTNLFAPRVTRLRDQQNGHRGVLISMGLTALDHCVSHGVELGHIVNSIRNAPHAQECERLEGFSMFYLVMRDGDLTGSETQADEFRSGASKIVDEGGDHSYCFNIQGRKKRAALIQDNW